MTSHKLMGISQSCLLIGFLFLNFYARAEDPDIYTVKCELTYDKDEKLMKMPGVSYNKDAFIWTIDIKRKKAFNWAAKEFRTVDVSQEGMLCMSYYIGAEGDHDFKRTQCINRFDGSYREDEDIKALDVRLLSIARRGQCEKVPTRDFPPQKF